MHDLHTELRHKHEELQGACGWLTYTVHVPISLNMNSQMRSDAKAVDSETVVTVVAIGGFALFC